MQGVDYNSILANKKIEYAKPSEALAVPQHNKEYRLIRRKLRKEKR